MDYGRLEKRSKSPALYHRHGFGKLFAHHLKEISKVRAGRADRDRFRSRLFDFISEFRVLRAALVAIDSAGPSAPGPDGRTARQLMEHAGRTYFSSLERDLRIGHYRPGRSRSVVVPKPGKSGRRTIWIQNVHDRIVARAAVMMLSPVVDADFSPTSFGFRPGRGVWDALAALENQIRDEGRKVITSADIKTAFDVVPLAKVLRAARSCFGNRVARFIKIMCHMEGDIGLRQGSPFSPFAFNLFADAYVDKVWSNRHPAFPLLRYADDLSYAAASLGEARELIGCLEAICTAAGTPLKTEIECVDLRNGKSIQWLGFELRGTDPPEWRIAPKSWIALENAFARCHSSSSSAPLRAEAVADAWLTYLAPTFEFENTSDVLNRLTDIGRQQGFTELPPYRKLKSFWWFAHERWESKRKSHSKADAGDLPADAGASEFVATGTLPWET